MLEEEATEENVKMSSYCKMCVINEAGNIKTDQEAHLLFLFLFIATSKSDFSHQVGTLAAERFPDPSTHEPGWQGRREGAVGALGTVCEPSEQYPRPRRQAQPI